MLLFGRWTHTVHTSRLIRVIQLSLSSVHTQCCQDALETKGWLHSNRSQPAVAHWTSVRRCVHSSPVGRGLEEFFPKDDAIEEAEKTGRQWEARELRQKSNDDLHKLWYVLLKERNMLITVKHEARRLGFTMPAPERMWKVRKSMARIKLVLGEREIAISKAKALMKEERVEQERRKELSRLQQPSNTSDQHSIAQ